MGKNTCSHPGRKMSPSKEEYLKAIYQLPEKAPFVRSTDLAVYLEISKSSMNSATTTLQEEGFVVKPLYSEICLTDKGQKQRQIIIVRFQPVKQLLVHCCDVNEQTANEDTCKMEHLINDETTLALKNVLDRYERSFPNNKGLKK